LGAPVPSESDQAAADAIILSAAAESRARANDVEDAPMVEGEVIEDGPTPGLHIPSKKHHRKEKRRTEEDGLASLGPAPETIYRDASGRIINVAMKRQEARKKAEEEERKKREEADQARGEVQLQMRDERRRDLEEAKYLSVARSADDREMNDELKEKQRWNDPAAGFLTEPKMSISGSKSKGSGKPTYQGAFEPNRYGLRPGYRWDGVDRGKGFEKKWFAARNKRKEITDLQYAWQMDE
jgi:pre-mRNA-splicing factor CWC26